MPPQGPADRRWFWIGALCLILLTAGLWLTARERLNLEWLVARESAVRDFQRARPLEFTAAAFAVYVLYVGLSLPGASVLTPLVGWLFGFWRGVVFASCAATAGATLAMLLSRYVLRDWVQRRLADRLELVNAAIAREGAWYLLTLRLVPAFPFFVVNLLLGLTRMPVRTYWWVSQLGMLPATCVFVFAGTTVPTLAEVAQSPRSIVRWPLLAALTAIGLLPLTLRSVVKTVRRKHAGTERSR